MNAKRSEKKVKGFLMNEQEINEMAEETKQEIKQRAKKDHLFMNYTDEELDALAEEGKKNTFEKWTIFNNDLSNFIDDTEGDDELQVILRGHLYIEREITEMLRVSLKEPDEVLNNRFMFANKLNLAVALGVIEKENKPVFEKLNKLRNKLAHTINFKINESHFLDLYNSISGKLKESRDIFFAEESEEENLINKIRLFIGFLWTTIRIDALILPQKIETQKLKIQTAELHSEIDALRHLHSKYKNQKN